MSGFQHFSHQLPHCLNNMDLLWTHFNTSCSARWRFILYVTVKLFDLNLSKKNWNVYLEQQQVDNTSAQQAIEALICLVYGRKSSCGYMTSVFGTAQGVLLRWKTARGHVIQPSTPNPVRISDDLKRPLANVNTMTKLGRGGRLPSYCLRCLMPSKIQRSIRLPSACHVRVLKNVTRAVCQAEARTASHLCARRSGFSKDSCY